MDRKHYSRLLWCSICFLVIFTMIPHVLFDTDSRLDKSENSVTLLTLNWEIAYESELTEKSKWVPFDTDEREKLVNYEGSIWLKRQLPELEWNNPYLLFSLMRQFEVFLEGEQIYSFNMDNQQTRIHPHALMHFVNVEPGLTGKQLLIHAIWSKEPLLGHDIALAGELSQFLYLTIVVEMGYLLTGLISILSGVVGLFLFVARRERLYGWFSLFCLSIGIAMLLSCRSPQWFIELKEIYYWGQLLLPLTIWACVGFFAHALYIHRMTMIRLIHHTLGVFALFIGVLAVVDPILYYRLAGKLDAAIAIGGFIAVSLFIVLSSSRTKWGQRGSDDANANIEKRWILRGYWTFTIGGATAQFVYLFPHFLSMLHNEHHYWFRLFEGLMPNVLLLFMICMIIVMIRRVKRIYFESEQNAAELLEKNKELEQFHRNLEKLVENRTSELELANRTLAVTMREKAETIAEISVLEERNRIAYEIHDVVGHTLTAAIVQLEATKKIAIREKELPLDKLDMLSDLVRKGLDDIRAAVRLMKTDEELPLPLEEALRELIQYTKDTMEVEVECHISLQPGMSLGRMTDGVLYHALQEALTNGIRHGGSKRFRFELYCEDNMLYFRLTNDGAPFGSAQPGFGLSSMMERVELIGGTVTIRDSDQGCVVEIIIPH